MTQTVLPLIKINSHNLSHLTSDFPVQFLVHQYRNSSLALVDETVFKRLLLCQDHETRTKWIMLLMNLILI